MADFEIEITRESKALFEKDLKRFDAETKKGIKDVLRRVSLDILSESIKNLQEHGNVASGKLLKNGKFKLGRGGLFADVVYSGYAGAIEFGRRAGKFPPVDDIAQWVRRKLRVMNRKKAKSIAFAIAKSIAKNGTKASPFLAPAYDKHIKGFRGKVVNVINKVNK